MNTSSFKSNSPTQHTISPNSPPARNFSFIRIANIETSADADALYIQRLPPPEVARVVFFPDASKREAALKMIAANRGEPVFHHVRTEIESVATEY